MSTIFRTAINAFRRPTSATESLMQPIMLVAASIGLCVIMYQEVLPAFAEAGYNDIETLMTLFGFFIASIVLLVVTLAPSAWRDVVAHQRLNDEAGFNVVGKKEQARMDRFDAAYQRVKARRRRLHAG
jgi:hypothetical protein